MPAGTGPILFHHTTKGRILINGIAVRLAVVVNCHGRRGDSGRVDIGIAGSTGINTGQPYRVLTPQGIGARQGHKVGPVGRDAGENRFLQTAQSVIIFGGLVKNSALCIAVGTLDYTVLTACSRKVGDGCYSIRNIRIRVGGKLVISVGCSRIMQGHRRVGSKHDRIS